VQASLAHIEYQKHKINVLDTPGTRDFLGDTQNCMVVCEGAVLVVSGPDGVDPYSVRLFKQAEGKGRCIVINQLGRERADFDRALDECKEKLSSLAVPVTLPIGKEGEFRGVVNLLTQKAHIYEAGSQSAPKVEAVPADMQDAVSEAREALLEEIAGTDEALMEKYLESGELSETEIHEGLRRAISGGTLCPVFATDAVHNIGVFDVLNSIVESFPAPQPGAVFKGVNKAKEPVDIVAKTDGPMLAVVFKTIVDQHAGKISLFRVISGKAEKDCSVQNTTGESERFGSLLAVQGKKTTPIDGAAMGDLVAVAKLKETHTGDTLFTGNANDAATVTMPPLPPPQITFRILPKAKADEDRIGQSVEKIREEDPTITSGHDQMTSELTLSGFGVAHIDVSLEKMERKYGVSVEKKQPLVPYREFITKEVRDVEGKHKKQSGGRGQFGVCYIHMRPRARGEGYRFVDSIFGGSIPRNFIPAVDKGIQEASIKGVLAGYPLVDFEVELVDGKYHDVDSSEMAFKIAGSKAFKEAVEKAGVSLLEPITNVTVEAPEECLGDVVGDISSRRGRVLGMETVAGVSTVKAQIPQSEILTYSPDLKSMTGGRGFFVAVFSHFDPVPSNLIEKIAAESPNKPQNLDEDGQPIAAAAKKKK
jgi:elongation factor G